VFFEGALMNHFLWRFWGAAGDQSVELMVAASMFERARGLLARKALRSRQGMLLRPCSLIHTVGMRYAIDVIYLDKTGRVVKVTEALVPGRVDGHWRARIVLEMAAHEARRCGIVLGLHLPMPQQFKALP
jgi:uncharacterized membrane protein (UPF0127 family)